jgi:prepilin-type processing-associated H-X9-DG protein/prepilin-type N-terminal cleavage/methylation domain-containing protein
MRESIVEMQCKAPNVTFRSGFTVLECLVVITVMSVLLALLVPAVQAARESSRQITCKDRLRQMAAAVTAFDTTFGRLPAPATFRTGADGVFGAHSNWVVDILPMLDARSLRDRWDLTLRLDRPQNQALANTHIAVLTCPSDISVAGGGDLSFVVNRGIGRWVVSASMDCDHISSVERVPLDLNGNGSFCASDERAGIAPDVRYWQAMTLFINAIEWRSRHWKQARAEPSLARITDGTSTTLLIVENLRTGFDPAVGQTNWATSDDLRTGFYIPDALCRGGHCKPGHVDFAAVNSGNAAVNAGRNAPEGHSPWPSSFHPGGVNVAFADGHVQFLSDHISGQVYFQLCTPSSAVLNGTPLDAGVLSGVDF